MGSSAEFQAELLNLNGLLQASITELRYRCEVYRLSLKSISKVLFKVHQESHLRFLTTSGRSFQAYLLLSQKNALSRIGNVVRKASTFINGYSLVDKGLFQPPPPKPGCTTGMDMDKKIFPPLIAALSDGSESLSSSSKTPAIAASASHESGGCKYDGRLVLSETNIAKSDGDGKARHSAIRHTDKEKSKKKHRNSNNSKRLRERKNNNGSDAGKQKQTNEISEKKLSKTERSGSEQKDERSRNNRNWATSTLKLVSSLSRHGSRLNKAHSSPRRSNSSTTQRALGRNDQAKKLPSLLTLKMSQSHNLNNRTPTRSSRKTFSTQQQLGKDRLRDVVRRTTSRRATYSQNTPRDGRNSSGGGASSGTGTGSKDSSRQSQNRRSPSAQNRTHSRENSRYSSHSQNQSRNKIRESLAVLRNRRTSTATRQGQGVGPKYLFSGGYGCSNNNSNGFKLPSLPRKTERVKRVRLDEGNEDDDVQKERQRNSGCSPRKVSKP